MTDGRGGGQRGDRDGGGMGAALQSRRREVKKAAGIKEQRGVFLAAAAAVEGGREGAE